MPELIQAESKPNGFFGIVRCQDDADDRSFRIGLSENAYKGWRKVLTTRPFDPLNCNRRRYFFSGAGRHSNRKTYARIRIEQDQDGKEFNIDLPEDMVANLVWFLQMRDYTEAEHLRIQTNKETEQGGDGDAEEAV